MTQRENMLRTKESVSIIADEDVVIFEDNDVVTDTPEVGDVAVWESGRKRFLKIDKATDEQIASAVKIGVVYSVEGRRVRVVGRDNGNSKQWSCVCDFEITAIPNASGSLEVKLNNIVQGNFDYVRESGTKEEFCEQLDAWLKSQPSDSKSAKWEAFVWNDKAYLQMWNYNEYESTCLITNTTLNKLVGNELAKETISFCLNQVKQSATYNGMCRERMDAYVRTNTASNCNPTTRMNGTTQLFGTFPCSETYYNGDLGDGLRENFATYDAYLDACMVRLLEINKGIMQYREGKPLCDKLLPKMVLKQGIETPAYTAVHYANNYDANVAEFGQGKWWLPSMYELAILMRDIRTDKKDIVNTTLAKLGWTTISTTSPRWSCCRFNAYYAWNYISSGLAINSNFYSSFIVGAVSAFNLEN